MNKSMLAVLSAIAGLSAACASTPVKGKPMGGGSIYSEVQFNETITQEAIGSKRGESCATAILGVVATGDASAANAAKKAGINKIGSIDATHSNVLGLFSKYCVAVSGD